MSKEAFRQYYAELTDDQLAQVLIDRKDLVPEAVSAIDREVQRRHMRASEPPGRFRLPATDEEIQSLEGCYGYQRLLRKKRFMGRFWYLLPLYRSFSCLYLQGMRTRTGEHKAQSGVGYSHDRIWVFLKLRVST